MLTSFSLTICYNLQEPTYNIIIFFLGQMIHTSDIITQGTGPTPIEYAAM